MNPELAPLYGLETEYGLFVPDLEPTELVDASRYVVQAVALPSLDSWDYRWEDPRRDQRGFRVAQLAVDPRDKQFDRPSQACATIAETHSNRVLPNGARLYNDHGHPEYSTPECATLADLLVQHRVGDEIALDCARRRYPDQDVAIYKNNTDFSGASYGSHENYLVPRDVPFERLLSGLLPFLVTRQVYAGAGKVGVEEDPAADGPVFQLSQRADFCTVDVSVDTLAQRPIFNTRDEPHADPRRFRRLHVIVGDSNMSDFATALKVGSTLAVLDLCVRGEAPPIELANPVAAIKSLSRDVSLDCPLRTRSGATITALEVQGSYLEAARELGDGGDPDRAWTLQAWDEVLTGLEHDASTLASRLDWVAKRELLETFLSAEGADWQSDVLQSLDLEYHNVDPEAGLARRLEAQGSLERLVSEEAVADGRARAPGDTRAAVRGACVSRWPQQVRSLSWNRVELDGGAGVTLFFDSLVGRRLPALGPALDAASSPSELQTLMGDLTHA